MPLSLIFTAADADSAELLTNKNVRSHQRDALPSLWLRINFNVCAAVGGMEPIMLKRLLTGAVLVAILIPVFIFYDTFALPLLFAAVAAVAMYETAKCVGIADKKHLPVTLPAYLIAAVLPFFQYSLGASGSPYIIAVAAVLVFVLYALGVFGVVKRPLSPMTQFLTMLVYVSGASVSVTAVAFEENGGFILPFLFLGSWLTDTFAYLCGTLFGRHKLIPKVSPKKTVEGSVGAILFTLAFFALYGLLVASLTELTPNYPALMLTGFALSVLSQIGDLNASYIKRVYGIKDYGRIFPGHGGMLDRFDSVIAIAPVICLLSLAFTYFN